VFGLQAPAAIPVEVRSSSRRLFRLSWSLGEEGLLLQRPAPFELGEPVQIRFLIPGTEPPMTLRATVQAADDEDGQHDGGGRGLKLIDPPREAREALHRYVAQRLGLPGH
jgi:hypothetical protein